LNLVFRLAWKELAQHRALALSFILNLCLGLVGFLTLDTFKSSISENLAQRSRTILGADISIGSRRSLTEEEIAIAQNLLPEGSRTREERSLFSMAWNGHASRLVEVRVVDSGFPDYGSLKLRKQGAITHTSKKTIVSEPAVWIYPELAHLLGVASGDEIQLGNMSFRVDDYIESDPSVSNMGFSPAPKVMIGRPFLEETGLLGFGSRQQHRLLIALPKETSVKPLAELLRKALPQSDLTLKTHRQASRQLSRLLAYLSDYLGLVSLVALFLSAVGTAYLFQSFVEERKSTMATLMAMGLPFSKVFSITLLQLVMLGAGAVLGSLFLTFLLLPQLPLILGNLMVSDVDLQLGFRSVLLATLTGLGGALLFCLPTMVRLGRLSPSDLFRESAGGRGQGQALWAWIPILLVFWALGIWQAQSFKVGSLFIGIFLGGGLAALLLGWLLTLLLNLFARKIRLWPLRMAFLNLARKRRATLTCFCAIGLASFLLSLIPQLAHRMASELETGSGDRRPSLFLFDIQPDQVKELNSFFDARDQEIEDLSPIVNARFLSINGNPIDLDQQGFGRESERRQAMVNRRLNLSSRLHLSDAEVMLSGKPFSGSWSFDSKKPVEASLEVRYAKRLGLSLGDRFRVDIQGLDIEAEVINLRKVRWASFQPNFFVLLQPGLLKEAPRTHLATLYDLDQTDRTKLQRDIASRFSNIGVVDITQTLDRLLTTLDRMMFAIQITSLLSSLAGLGVLFSISRQQMSGRLRDLFLLRHLGATPSTNRKIVLGEFFLLGLLAGMFGLLMGLGGGWTLGHFLFDGGVDPDLSGATFHLLAIVGTTLVTGALASGKALGEKSV
jgi:putative ABC transport system permease protein